MQVLVEMENGGPVTRRTRDYVEGAIPKMFVTARDIRAVVTIVDEEDRITVQKYENNPTKELRERAWK